MILTRGARLGPYEVQAAIGAGGMGEVYKATDTRLDRVVALKILPESLASDPQFRDRFDREARTISQLDHPHICALHDVGEQDGTAYLVMQYLEGETLEHRLQRSAVPFEEALTIATQIVDALTAAHRRGIVHRDIKPGNVMLTKSGAKLLDFGLAKATSPVVASVGPSMMATTPQNLTAQGAILGTFQYMAPEQLEGAEADARSDIFALGCVLYELFTGQKAFDGKTPAALMAAILEREPISLVTVQPLTPVLVDVVVRKCLAKNADDRWQSVADAGTALRWVGTGADAVHGLPAVHGARRSRIALPSAAAAIVLVSAAVGVLGWGYLANESTRTASARFEILPPPGALWTPSPVASATQPVLSLDGRRLAFVATRKGGLSQLWVRPLDRLDAQSLAGTEGASFPFWSPDGRSLGFFAGGKLKTIDTMGGGAQVLCDAPSGRGGSWNADGVIVFSGSPNSVIWRISASGGVATEVTKFAAGDKVFGHNWPQFLPDGRHFLFYHRSALVENQGVFVGSLDSAAVTPVLQSGSMAVYSSGHLLFARDGALFAQSFDDRTLRTAGEPIRIGDHVGYFTASLGFASITASSTGVLVFGPDAALTTSLRWLDRAGTSAGAASVPAVYNSPRLSPDQKRVAVAITDATTPNRDIWVIDVARGTSSRATFDPSADWFPAWGPDGTQMFFGSARTGATSIFRKTGAGQDELFLTALGNNTENNTTTLAKYPNDTSADGRFLVYTESAARGYDLVVLSLAGERKAETFLSTPFNEVQGRFSPNGRWIAYASDESGQFEVYVRSFPVTNDQWKVSVAGGTQPEWRRDGKELFYISVDQKMMAVPVTFDGGSFGAGVPRALFDVEVAEVSAPFPTEYTVTSDGQRFLVNTIVEQTSQPTLTVVLNWSEELKRRFPVR
jgi:Tol biopolymer transport system component